MISRSALSALTVCAWICLRAETAPDNPDETDIATFLQGAGDGSDVIGGDCRAADVLAAARAMLPEKPLELRGSIVRRGRRGFAKQSCDYLVRLDRGKSPATMEVALYKRGDGPRQNRPAGSPIVRETLTRPGKVPEGKIMGTDVTWWDLTLDFLWWDNPRFEADREGESVHGQKCCVILVSPPDPAPPGISAVRIWADKRTGCMMQAEALDADMKPVRRLWGTRVRKFGERWMANVLEVETLGTHHRTKILVDELSVEE